MDGYLLSLHIEMLDIYFCQPVSRGFAYRILTVLSVFTLVDYGFYTNVFKMEKSYGCWESKLVRV